MKPLHKDDALLLLRGFRDKQSRIVFISSSFEARVVAEGHITEVEDERFKLITTDGTSIEIWLRLCWIKYAEPREHEEFNSDVWPEAWRSAATMIIDFGNKRRAFVIEME